MKETRVSVILFYALFFLYKPCSAQIDSASVMIPQLMALQNNHNLISKAIDGAVYLVRQEYVLETPDGKPMTRGILNYFGKSYSIGVLVKRDLWIPSSLRKPWNNDSNFKEYEKQYKPVCSQTRIKKIDAEEEYRVFELKDSDLKTQNLLISFRPGIEGLNVSDSLPERVKLLLYYVENDQSPDNGKNIKSTIMNLHALKWDESGKAEINDIKFKDRMILGGAVFTEKVRLGRIDVELIALYTEDEGNWVLQTVSPVVLQKVQNN